jgi:hypothetical protein
VSAVADPTTWHRVLGLLSDGDWHTEEELEEVVYYPEYWIRELEESGYSVQKSAWEHPSVRLLTPASGE